MKHDTLQFDVVVCISGMCPDSPMTYSSLVNIDPQQLCYCHKEVLLYFINSYGPVMPFDVMELFDWCSGDGLVPQELVPEMSDFESWSHQKTTNCHFSRFEITSLCWRLSS